MWSGVGGGGGLRCRSLNPFSNHDSSSSRGQQSKMEVVQFITWWSKEARSKKGQHSRANCGANLFVSVVFSNDLFKRGQNGRSIFIQGLFAQQCFKMGVKITKELVVSNTSAQNIIHQSEKKNRNCSSRNKLPTHLTHLQRSNSKAKIIFLGHTYSTQHQTLVVFLVVVGFMSGCNHWQLINYIMSGQASL